MLRGGRVGQRVTVRVREEHPQRPLAGLVVIGDAADRERAAVEGRAGRSRRPVGRALPGVRPRAVAFAGDGEHLRLVGRARLQVRQVECPGAGPQRAAIGRPCRRVDARRGLLAVLRLVAGDGLPVGVRGRPRHVQGRVGRPAELRAGHRRRGGCAGLDVGDDDADVDCGRIPIDRVFHFAAVELGDHLALPGFRLPVAVVRLVVQRRALLATLICPVDELMTNSPEFASHCPSACSSAPRRCTASPSPGRPPPCRPGSSRQSSGSSFAVMPMVTVRVTCPP